MAGLEGPVRATYEAGPTGFALARLLEAAGVDCLVCAPGLVPRGSSDRVKTDQCDAERLARLLIAGELSRVTVPTVEAESLRDLVRAREDLRGDLMTARHRLSKLLLRHDVRFDGPERKLNPGSRHARRLLVEAGLALRPAAKGQGTFAPPPSRRERRDVRAVVEGPTTAAPPLATPVAPALTATGR